MTVTLDAPALLPAPTVDDIPPAKTLTELLAKLEQLGSADAIAKFFYNEGVRGERNIASGCPIAKWLTVETGGEYSVNGASVCEFPTSKQLAGGRKEGVVALPDAAREFIRNFDTGAYAHLAIGRTAPVPFPFGQELAWL